MFFQEKPFGELFSKVGLRLARKFMNLRNPTKSRIPVAAAINSAENLDIFTPLSEKDGLVNQNDHLHVCLIS